jgi:hypothetical protein
LNWPPYYFPSTLENGRHGCGTASLILFTGCSEEARLYRLAAQKPIDRFKVNVVTGDPLG